VKLDPRVASGPLVALVALLLISLQTADAIRRTSAPKQDPIAKRPTDDPLLDLERRLATLDPTRTLAIRRDPFSFVADPPPLKALTKARPPAPPPPAPTPVLTAIIWDNDPRASIRWNGRDYVVKANSQVSDYQVILIGRDQVLLAHGDESLVLRMHRKGD